MILTAGVVAKNEIDRFLAPVIADLRTYADQIVVLDDGSDDGTDYWLRDQVDEQLGVAWNDESRFFAHEGRCRQQLLTLVLGTEASHVLAVDCDELVADGSALRSIVERSPATKLWTLRMSEVWTVTPDCLRLRVDGGWRVHDRPMLWRVPRDRQNVRMLDRKLACSRVPAGMLRERPVPSGIACYHFGWTDPATRRARYERYVEHDGGRFHASSHLASIMWPESRMRFEDVPWPAAAWAAAMKERLL